MKNNKFQLCLLLGTQHAKRYFYDAQLRRVSDNVLLVIGYYCLVINGTPAASYKCFQIIQLVIKLSVHYYCANSDAIKIILFDIFVIINDLRRIKQK